MRLLVTGAAGLLGSAIVREFSTTAQIVALGRHSLDITDPAAVSAALAAYRPQVVVNCAVYNGVDAAEEEPVAALSVNALAVKTLAVAAAQADAALVHYSSDFVFDGEADRPYSETDRPNPQSVYGASKLLGEWLALDDSRAYVLRVESLFGPPGRRGSRGSLAAIIEQIRQGSEVPVFVDRTVSPAYTPHVARATRTLLEAGAPAGLYHCVNSGHATWAQIGARAAAALDLPFRMRPITLESAGLRARRPKYCAMSNSKLVAAGCEMPPWEVALDEYLAVLDA
jgi:dTDP-4-dehydrorhamnose reductase